MKTQTKQQLLCKSTCQYPLILGSLISGTFAVHQFDQAVIVAAPTPPTALLNLAMTSTTLVISALTMLQIFLLVRACNSKKSRHRKSQIAMRALLVTLCSMISICVIASGHYHFGPIAIPCLNGIVGAISRRLISPLFFVMNVIRLLNNIYQIYQLIVKKNETIDLSPESRKAINAAITQRLLRSAVLVSSLAYIACASLAGLTNPFLIATIATVYTACLVARIFAIGRSNYKMNQLNNEQEKKNLATFTLFQIPPIKGRVTGEELNKRNQAIPLPGMV